jgi:crossover junction endodeoxyribonuclease RusA
VDELPQKATGNGVVTKSFIEFLIPHRPLSLQAKPKSKQDWKKFVRNKAEQNWGNAEPIRDINLCLTLVYLCDDSPPDIDNIIKPIQDALVGLIYEDDCMIADVGSHRRFLSDPLDLVNLPSLLVEGALIGKECVYVRVGQSKSLENYL